MNKVGDLALPCAFLVSIEKGIFSVHRSPAIN